MCCGNKKKRSDSASLSKDKKATSITKNSKNQTAKPHPLIPPVNIPASYVDQSRVNIALQKSSFTITKPNSPNIQHFNLFKDCTAENIELNKVTHEHNCYVRQYDYFQLSNSHIEQLKQINKVNDKSGRQCSLAKYDMISTGQNMGTPNINRFCYNRNVVDVGHKPVIPEYKNYQRQFIHDNTINMQVKDYSRQKDIHNNKQNDLLIKICPTQSSSSHSTRSLKKTVLPVKN